MKPRKPLIKLPSLSEDDAGPPPKIQKLDENRSNSPSTSVDRQSPKIKSVDTIAKIRGITNEIRQLTSLSKAYESKLKRPYLNNDNPVPDKKQKLD